MPLKFYDEFWRSIKSWKQRKHFCQNTNILEVFHILRGVSIFYLIFLSHFFTKWLCSCACWKGNFLNFSKLILLFPLVHFKRLKRALTQNLHFYGGHPVVALKGLWKTVEAYIIKWTISSESPVGIKSPQDSKWGHSWTLHYFTKGSSQKKKKLQI